MRKVSPINLQTRHSIILKNKWILNTLFSLHLSFCWSFANHGMSRPDCRLKLLFRHCSKLRFAYILRYISFIARVLKCGFTFFCEPRVGKHTFSYNRLASLCEIITCPNGWQLKICKAFTDIWIKLIDILNWMTISIKYNMLCEIPLPLTAPKAQLTEIRTCNPNFLGSSTGLDGYILCLKCPGKMAYYLYKTSQYWISHPWAWFR